MGGQPTVKKMTKLVAYIRGGLGDVWPAISAITPIIKQHNISKFDIIIISDSVYYFRDYPKGLEQFSLSMLHKISSNVIMVPPWINNNFRIDVDDVTEELSQENADKMTSEFMFWRPYALKEFVRKHIDKNTIFIDALFTECIMEWDFKNSIYKRVGDERAVLNFNPPQTERSCINSFIKLFPKHVLIHTRKKQEGNSQTKVSGFYNDIIEFCNLNNITPAILGVDSYELKGKFIDWRGDDVFSFEGMGYLIDECNVMLGNDSGFSAIKLYQQQKNKLLIMEYPRWERSPWYFRAIKNKSNYLLLDARNNNFEKITKSIKGYYETSN